MHRLNVSICRGGCVVDLKMTQHVDSARSVNMRWSGELVARRGGYILVERILQDFTCALLLYNCFHTFKVLLHMQFLEYSCQWLGCFCTKAVVTKAVVEALVAEPV